MSPSCRLTAALLILAAVPALGAPEHRAPDDWQCATGPGRFDMELARHEWNERLLARQPALRSVAGPDVRQEGDVLVIEDDGTLVRQTNVFDLEDRGYKFKRKGDGFKVSNGPSRVKASVGDRLVIGDDDSVQIDLPFSVTYYGVEHDTLWVNSDGNLTFEAPDSASTSRDLSRMLNGPPRIAPLFTDLDPSVAPSGGGVFVNLQSKKIQVTWLDVPEFGTSNRNSFQISMKRNGKINIALGEVDARAAIVGTSPGNVAPVLLVDLSEDIPLGPEAVAIAEQFSLEQQVDIFGIASTFYQHLGDDYDHMIIWLDFTHSLDGAIAYHLGAQNAIRGIGEDEYDFTEFFGSDGRLESFVMMGALGQYATNPSQGIFFGSTFSTLDILGHETAHRWLVRVRFQGANGPTTGLLGRGDPPAHWSLTSDSDASLLEGADLRDNGDGTFTTVAAGEGFSTRDLYLMGFLPPDDVTDTFVVATTDVDPSTAAPQVGVTMSGTRVNVSIDDIIAVEGRRVPSSDDARRDYRMAMVVVGRSGEPVSQDSIDKVDRIRRDFEGFWSDLTGGESSFDTTIEP